MRACRIRPPPTALSAADRFRLNAYLARHCLAQLRVRQLPTGALILEAAEETRLDESA